MPTRKKASRGTASGKGRGATRDAAALRASLARWDGRTASTIEAVFEWWRGDSALPRLLAQLLDEGELDVAVTWLIKRGLGTGIGSGARQNTPCDGVRSLSAPSRR